MKGKVLRVFNNDLYGHSDERKAIVFATFIHKKYMNKYAIFIFQNEYHKNKLNYGSIHIKENSLVVFKVRPELKSIFDEFLIQYTNQQLVDFELIDISNLTKVEVIGYNELDYPKLSLLEDLSIPKSPVNISNDKTSSSTFKLIIPIIILIVGAIGAYLFLNPGLFEFKVLICSRESYHRDIKLDYQEKLTIVYDGKNNLKQYDVEETYYFKNSTSYQEFKGEGKQYLYFSSDDKSFKYNDKKLELIVTYQRSSNVFDSSKMKYQLEQAGYNCTEDTYEK